MNDGQESQAGTDAVVGTHAVEVGVAFGLFVLGVVVVADSVRIGRGWAPDGPEAGFYPFYVGLTLCAASGWIGLRNVRKGSGRSFVSQLELRRVLSVLLPSVVYVASLFWIGMYVASTLFLSGFMRYLGKYAWARAVPVSLVIVGCFFALFELWFKVPLPKGPLEAWLGL
jgi:putative tricarboxylic transport membrane protein